MAEPTHLKNAPIKEAIIDFRATLPSEFDVESFRGLKERLGDRYTRVEEQKTYEGRFVFQMKGGVAQSAVDKGVTGFLFHASDKRSIAQFRLNGFTFNWTGKYTSWEAIFPEARKLWELYREVGEPVTVERLAARYVNRFEVPLTHDVGVKYLTAPPATPCRNVAISAFISRVTVRDEESGASAHITQALERTMEERKVDILLDIDVFKEQTFEPDGDSMWETFEVLHRLKNHYFFDSVTDEARRLFE